MRLLKAIACLISSSLELGRKRRQVEKLLPELLVNGEISIGRQSNEQNEN